MCAASIIRAFPSQSTNQQPQIQQDDREESPSVSCPTHSEVETAARLSHYSKCSAYLSGLSDEEMEKWIENATPLSTRSGGEVRLGKVGKVPVIVKKIALTSRELIDKGATRNYFGLPLQYQYRVGSMGFGVWRELAAHEQTTQWVLNGECQNFPLMYHNREMNRCETVQLLSEAEKKEVEEHVEYWEGDSAIDAREAEVITAPADVVIFLEYIPHQLEKRLLDDDKTDLSKVEKEVLTVTAFMKTRGFAHCDAHFRNILTDDSHVYFTDFGLSMSRAFELSPEEHAFLEEHSDFDRYSVAAELAWLAVASSLGEEGTHARVDEYLSSSDKAQTLPPSVAAVASRYGAVAKLTYQFLDDLRATKTTPYPKEALDREWSKIHSN